MQYSSVKDAVEVLKRNHVVTVGSQSIKLGSIHPGIKQWGAIDYLMRVHKYVLVSQDGTRS